MVVNVLNSTLVMKRTCFAFTTTPDHGYPELLHVIKTRRVYNLRVVRAMYILGVDTTDLETFIVET